MRSAAHFLPILQTLAGLECSERISCGALLAHWRQAYEFAHTMHLPNRQQEQHPRAALVIRATGVWYPSSPLLLLPCWHGGLRPRAPS